MIVLLLFVTFIAAVANGFSPVTNVQDGENPVGLGISVTDAVADAVAEAAATAEAISDSARLLRCSSTNCRSQDEPKCENCWCSNEDSVILHADCPEDWWCLNTRCTCQRIIGQGGMSTCSTSRNYWASCTPSTEPC